MLIDTHAHIYLDNFKEDLDEVVLRAKDKDVNKIILPNIDENSVSKVFELCNRHTGVLFPALGLHPTSVRENFKMQIEQILNTIPENVCAIGETGIDLYWDKTFLNQQKEAFEIQLNIAKDRNLPVIIHSRESMTEILEILDILPNGSVKGVFHCYSGNYQQAVDLVARGFFLGIGGVITYKNNKLVDIVKSIPLENLLLETDSPFLTPVPFRGKRNEPTYINYIAAKIADIKNIDIKKVAMQTSINAEKCFKI